MQAKDKAKELVCKMYGCEIDTDLNDIYTINGDGYFIAKDSALIAVNEILDIFDNIDDIQAWYYLYWQDVKTEINKL